MNKKTLVMSAIFASTLLATTSNFSSASGVQEDSYSLNPNVSTSVNDPTLSVEAANVKYHIVIKTSQLKDSGTDSNLTITIFGTKNNAYQKFNLSGAFERGSIDTLDVNIADIGSIRKVTLATDGSGNKPGWRPEYVEITSPNGTDVRFSQGFNRFIGSGGPDSITVTN